MPKSVETGIIYSLAASRFIISALIFVWSARIGDPDDRTIFAM